MKTFGAAPLISPTFKFIDAYRFDLTPHAVLALTLSCLKLIYESDIKSFLCGVGQLNGSGPSAVAIVFFNFMKYGILIFFENLYI